jgi:hypothetical protein
MNRDEEFIASHHRAKSRHVIRAGVKQDGTLTSIYHQIIGQAGPDPQHVRFAVGGGLYQAPLSMPPHEGGAIQGADEYAASHPMPGADGGRGFVIVQGGGALR